MENKLKISENTVVHCTTEELANEVLKIAHDLGYKWKGGNSYLKDNYWSFNNVDTCYNLHRGKMDSIDYYKNKLEPFEIISAQDFIALHKEKTEFPSLEEIREATKKYLAKTPKEEIKAKIAEFNGVKHSKNKPPLYTLLKQFNLAFIELAKCTQAGHLKYIETDVDYMNYKRVPNAEFEYKNAAVRHLLEEGINQDMLEYGQVSHEAQTIWNLLAALQIKLENNGKSHQEREN